MYQGPKVFRTGRRIATEKGTTPAGFAGQLIPESGPPDPNYPTPYRDPGEDVRPAPGTALREPDPNPKPFKVG